MDIQIQSVVLYSKSSESLPVCALFYKSLGFQLVEERKTRIVMHYDTTVGIDLEIRVIPDTGQGLQSFSLLVPSLPVFASNRQLTLDSTNSLKDPLGNTITLLTRSRFHAQPATPITFTLPSPIITKSNVELEGKGRKIGVLTSGGDSCGMNAAVRAIVRVSLQKGCFPYAIYEGYQGLVDNKIKAMGWDDVRGYLSKGGTLIGTARCAAFRTREGRLEGCLNLIKNGIDSLIVIGGDGSLTGANMFRQEWSGLVQELLSQGRVTENEIKDIKDDLTIVGLVGSIDNDMSCTDITIGATTSLHRICESVDSLVSTAQSHQRAFVIEVMGRNCGWLALMAAISVGADCVFLPERPPPFNQEKYGKDWALEMCDTVKRNRLNGNRKSLIIVSEGAIDSDLNPIKAEMVKKALEKIGLDTRVTTLGHVQRGGSSCAFDRYLATIQGQEAVEAALRNTKETPCLMVGMSNNHLIAVPLVDAVKMTQEVTASIAKKDFATAMILRDPEFSSSFSAYLESSHYDESNRLDIKKRLRVGILHCGAPSGGMNAATRIIVRLCHSRGHTPLAIRNGFSGLVNNEVGVIEWEQVRGWQTIGGSQLGTNRDHPASIPGITSHSSGKIDTGAIAFHLQKHDIHSLIIIGGFEAFSAQVILTEARKIYPSLCIPMVMLPATISNNIPSTDYSIGSDTALNVIVAACDSIRLSANASRKRVFVVEVHGGNCGYLSTLSALTVGATASYIPEEGLTLSVLQDDLKHLKVRYTEEAKAGIANEGRVILRSENTEPRIYSTSFISGMLRAEGDGLFDSRETVLGHLQQGDIPSPLDRIRATRLAVEAVDWLQRTTSAPNHGPFPTYTNKDEDSCIIGIKGDNIVATPVVEAKKECDMKYRRVLKPWWADLRSLIRVLGKREYNNS